MQLEVLKDFRNKVSVKTMLAEKKSSEHNVATHERFSA